MGKRVTQMQPLEFLTSRKLVTINMALKLCALFIVLAHLFVAINAFPSDAPTPTALVFKANFSKPTISQAFGGAKISYGEKNAFMWASGGGVDIQYPKGTFGGEGGFGVYTEHPVSAGGASFKYSVFFPEGFNFVKGGKLSGLYGGKKNCAGGDPAVDCFSTRLMWREDGKGELYLYANREAQDQSICEMPGNYCAPVYGWSLNKGAWTFKTGVWTDIQEVIRLNTPGKQDGHLSVKINGKEVIRYDNLVFRIPQYPNIKIEGMHVSTFFGGSSQEWATPVRQVAKFKEFILETA